MDHDTQLSAELRGGRPTEAGLAYIAKNRANWARVFDQIREELGCSNAECYWAVWDVKDAVGALYASCTSCPSKELPLLDEPDGFDIGVYLLDYAMDLANLESTTPGSLWFTYMVGRANRTKFPAHLDGTFGRSGAPPSDQNEHTHCHR